MTDNTIKLTSEFAATCASHDGSTLYAVRIPGENVTVVGVKNHNDRILGVARLTNQDALALAKHITDNVPQAPEMPGESKYIPGLGGKQLEIEVANSLGQLVVHLHDLDGKHHIVINKPEAERLTWLLETAYPRRMPMQPMPQPPTDAELKPWMNPGTLCTPVPGEETPFEICLVADNTLVELSWAYGLEGMRVCGPELDAIIGHLVICRNNLKRQVKVHYVKSHIVDTNAENIVVTDLQGTPIAVLRSATELANYLSANKLTEVAK